MYIIKEKIEDVLEDGSVADRIMNQIYNLPIDCDKCRKAGEPFCKCKDHDCKLKEKGFCECVEHEHEDSIDADGTCLVCGEKDLI